MVSPGSNVLERTSAIQVNAGSESYYSRMRNRLPRINSVRARTWLRLLANTYSTPLIGGTRLLFKHLLSGPNGDQYGFYISRTDRTQFGRYMNNERPSKRRVGELCLGCSICYRIYKIVTVVKGSPSPNSILPSFLSPVNPRFAVTFSSIILKCPTRTYVSDSL
jgi:hypothetical protein